MALVNNSGLSDELHRLKEQGRVKAQPSESRPPGVAADGFRGLRRQEVHDPHQWAFTTELERSWPVIKAEFEALQRQLFMPWPEQDLYKQNDKLGTGWDVFGLYAFGKRHKRNTRLCPETTKLVETIPGLSTAAFSVLQPKSNIIPHVGYYGYSDMVLRCHLGVIVPDGCRLHVGEHVLHWQDGKCLVFDDTFLHSAVNEHPTAQRVVLLLDFVPPGVSKVTDPQQPQLTEQESQSQRVYLDKLTREYGFGDDSGDE